MRFAQLSGVSGQLQTYRTYNKQKSNDTNAKHYNNKTTTITGHNDDATATGRQQTRQQNPGARTDTSPLCEATSKTIITGCNKPERQPRETTTTQQQQTNNKHGNKSLDLTKTQGNSLPGSKQQQRRQQPTHYSNKAIFLQTQ